MNEAPSRVERYVRWVLAHPRWVLGGCLVLSLLAGLSASRLVVATSFARMFLGENPGYETYRAYSATFGGDELFLIGLEDPELLAPAGQERLRRAAAAVRQVPGVARVRSLLDVVQLRPGPLGPTPVRWTEELAADPTRLPALRAALQADPFAGALLIGRDGASTSLVVEVSDETARRAEEAPRVVDAVLAACRAVYPPERVHRAGLVALVAEVLDQTFRAVTVTTPLVATVLLLSVWLLFGRLWPAAISLGVSAVAVLWTLGVAALLDRELNILMATVPAVILIVAFSDIVHLCSAYLLELSAGRPKHEAVRHACVDVGRACLFTSLTTFVGFLSLSLVPVPVFRVLGLVLGLGVALALLLAVTLVPVLLTLLPEPRPLRAGRTAWAQALLDRVLGASLRLSIRRPGAVIAGFALASALAGAGALQLTIETDFSVRLRPENPVRQDAAWFEGKFRGTNLLQVYVTAPEPRALTDPAWVASVAALQRAIDDLPQVESSASLLDGLSLLYRATPAGRAAPPGALPATRQELATLLGLLRLGAGDELRGLVDLEAGRLRLLAYLPGHGMRETAAVAREVERLGARTLPGGGVEATGLLVLFGQFLDVIVAAQQQGLLTSSAVIALLMALGLRSWRVGLAAMPPNLFPLLVLAGCLGALWERVDSDAISLTFIALGIGVDDTIHFLDRYRLELGRSGDRVAAVERTFAFAGRGIVMTTVVLACGFLPFLLSDYFYMRMLGSLLPLCFVVALLADVLLVPALAAKGWLGFGRAGPPPGPGGPV